MFPYSMVFAKLGLGLLALILQINLLGKRNLAPSSALDQIQNYVLGGIIGGVIYNDTVSIIQFLMILVVWTILVMVLKFLKANSRLVKILVDGKPVILIEQGELQTETCLRYGIQAFELQMKLRAAGVQRIQDVKRAVLEQNGQLTVVQMGEKNIRFPLIADGQVNPDVLKLIDKDEAWLNQELHRQGYEPRDIFLAEYLDGQVLLYPYPPESGTKKG
ncbi:DUF421 domain-containing protein [Megasphaera elsdenii]|uniref:DUF421 domain-containing protein n=1 Tax=Megasphaera elsdenii DSM 20460 TaxID=1064535 RepID=G0VLN0_MEGEL|nr:MULTISPECIES: DUF421 domain-containing protein [Megasphaera]AVO75082.1 DUF421 domain-containing protein [Megasphaera elsdenii DSM 20460]MCQ4113344.1 DUF421 domain-containing protein [Megasphaera sp. SC8-1]CCC74228.1 putative uncharacterized protein [Megasphaera elsdenii DSM 20460]